MKRRVVITGMGAVTPLGLNVNETWENAKNGVNGIAPITLFDASNQKVKIAAEVKGFNPEAYFEPKEARRMDRTMLLGVVAATEAFEQTGLEIGTFDADRFGVFVSSGIGGLWTINEEARKAHERGPDRISPFFIPNSIVNLIGGKIAIKFQAKGPALPVVTACSSATNSIGEAFRYIRDGYIEFALAGGSEAPINELGVGGFASMKALSFNENVNEASIPFDLRRSGFVIGEGAGVIFLEEYEHAKKRNAKILGEIVGYGTTCDAYHITAPDETADGITKCMINALKDGNVDPSQIDYINPHGTSTYYNDRIETLGIKRVFNEHAINIPIGATKSMHGHALGAVGGIEAIITLCAMQEGTVPPTINYQEKDPECDLFYAPNHAIQKEIRYALSNSLGFGGQNATIIFKKWEES